MSIKRWVVAGTISILSSLGAAASPAWAESRQLTFTLSSQGNQTFAALKQQAESLAGNLTKQEFAKSSSFTEVSVTIVAEHNGQEVPLLFSTVSRFNWQKKPRIQPWIRYVSSSARLLGFVKPEVAQPVNKQPGFDSVAASMSDIEPNFYQ